jgi:hypothetical protein
VRGFGVVLKEAFQLFCKTDIDFLFEEKKIIIGNIEELVQTITNINEIKYLVEEDFFDFQNMVR